MAQTRAQLLKNLAKARKVRAANLKKKKTPAKRKAPAKRKVVAKKRAPAKRKTNPIAKHVIYVISGGEKYYYVKIGGGTSVESYKPVFDSTISKARAFSTSKDASAFRDIIRLYWKRVLTGSVPTFHVAKK